MKSYHKHLESTQAAGEAVSLIRRPIFRSSAIFPVLHTANYSSRVLFMGYWLLKRRIPEVQMLVTLRGEDGPILLRKSLLITEPKAFALRVGDLLAETALGATEADFTGSLELEIFATRDLVYPYPAFVLNYYGDEFMASVHTTGRVYNDIEDLQENEDKIVPECGFDILSGAAYAPFFAFVNGVYNYDNPVIEWTIIDEHGQGQRGQFTLPPVPAYATRFVMLRDYIDLDALLHGGKGTVKLHHQFRGFFPRFVAGNFEQHRHALSITHTYYDSSAVSDAGAYWGNTDERFHDSAVFAPLFVDEGEYTQLVFYPIYSPSAFGISLAFYDEAGALVGTVRDWRHLDLHATPDQFFTLSFNEVIAEHFPPEQARRLRGVNIVKHWPNREQIPTRLKFGLNVGRTGRAMNLPTNVCFNSQIANAKVLTKPGTFKWSPILDGDHSVVVILNGSAVKEYATPAHLQLSFYREADNQTLLREAQLPPFGQLRLDPKADTELREFLGGQPGWVTIQADNPFVTSWYFDFNESGAVGGDHAF
ncbi:hypothetical protein [Hymenobacter nivis]|uniref:hypothetical protein n=1 Tax=Hymenobacter nivis TaxID=1850093 RepID=UPI0013A59699|nr:hypothetical protein [Hymenobacter nivis]